MARRLVEFEWKHKIYIENDNGIFFMGVAFFKSVGRDDWESVSVCSPKLICFKSIKWDNKTKNKKIISINSCPSFRTKENKQI